MRESAHDIVRMALWMSLLRACSGAEGFMKKHQGRVTAQSMVDFVLFEPGFPRSIYYTLNAACEQLSRIWTEPTHISRKRLSSLVTFLQTQRTDLDVSQIHAVLTQVVDESAAICSRISEEILGPPRVAKPVDVPPVAGSQSQSQST